MPYSALFLQEEKYKAVWECAGDAMVFIDREGLLDCNEAGLRLFGLAEREALMGRPLAAFAPPLQPHGVPSDAYIVMHVEVALNSGQSRFECELLRGDGSRFMADIRLHRLQMGGGHAMHAVLRDITARWQAEQRLRNTKDAIEASLYQLSNFDAVTGLPNRVQFHERAQTMLVRAMAEGRPMVMCSLSINDINHINNSLGHDAGDFALKLIGERLVAAVQANDIVARVSGNVFGVLLDACTAESAMRAVQAMLAAATATFHIGGQEVCVGVSAGLSRFDADGQDVWELMQNAETAMYRAKADPAEAMQFYCSDMNTAALERLALESSLRHAIEHGELVVYYQPLVAADSGCITGVEALVRWQHPELGLVAPDRFIPLAEQSGLIVALGEWVLDTACRQTRAWQILGLPQIDVAVNLSPRQFRQSTLKDRVAQVLAASGLAPALLVLELTEGALMDHTEFTLRTLADLRAMGVRLALDDFGTGYSSLAYLKRFPIQKLKVDKSFVRDIGKDADDVVIAQAIINLGHNLRLEVIAEGIETPLELAALRAYGCNSMQGFLFSRAVPAAEIEAMLRRQAQGLPL